MAGIRVLEVAEHTFVPAASAVLSDWGADVIKVEHVERGDAMRGLGSTGVMQLGEGTVHVLNEHANRGKRSIGLDLSRPEGVEVLMRLAEISDVFLNNKLPRVRAKLGIDADAVRARNPRIVYVSGSGYGARGPDANSGGYDVLGYWCRSGLALAETDVDAEAPAPQPGPAYGDSIGAMTIAGGIAAALFHRERTGEAPVVDVSLLATGMWAMGAGIALSQQLGMPWRPPPADRSGIRNPLTTSYRTGDGRWLFMSCLQGFAYWADTCRVVGRPDLVDDERFATAEALSANAYVASQILAEEFGRRPMEEWKQRFVGFAGQWSPLQDTLEVAHDPQVVANGYLVESESSAGVRFPLVATPVQFDGAPSPTRRSPDFNEHAEEILVETLGLDPDEVLQLRIDGVVA